MTDLYKKGESFGIKGYRVEAMSLDAVYNYCCQATYFVRNGGGPIILEMNSYRYRGHSMSDPAKYRSKEEVENYREQDPILQVKNIIINNKYASEDE